MYNIYIIIISTAYRVIEHPSNRGIIVKENTKQASAQNRALKNIIEN